MRLQLQCRLKQAFQLFARQIRNGDDMLSVKRIRHFCPPSVKNPRQAGIRLYVVHAARMFAEQLRKSGNTARIIAHLPPQSFTARIPYFSDGISKHARISIRYNRARHFFSGSRHVSLQPLRSRHPRHNEFRQDFPSQRLGGTPVRHSVLVHQRPQAFLFEMGAPHAGGQHPLRRRR